MRNPGKATQPEAVSVMRLEPYHGLTTKTLLHGKGWFARELDLCENYGIPTRWFPTHVVSPTSSFLGTEMIP